MKHIFITPLIAFLLSPFTLICMEREEQISLPKELLEIVKDHAEVPRKTFSQIGSLYPVGEHLSQHFKYERVIPTSFDPARRAILKSHYWDSLINYVVKKPNLIKVGFETPFNPLILDQPYCVQNGRNSWGIGGIWQNSNDLHGTTDDLILVDNNESGQGFFAYSYPKTNTYGLISIKAIYTKEDATGGYKAILHNQPGEVTALTMYQKNEPWPRVVYLKKVKVPVPGFFCQSEEMRQHMVVAERNANGTLRIKLDALTPAEFKKIVPFSTNSCSSHFALSNKGKLWGTRGSDDGAVEYCKQIVRDRTGQKKRYQNFTINNEEGLLVTLDNDGNVFVGDTFLRVLMRLATIPNPQDVINLSHTHDATGNKIHVVYDKSFFGNGYNVTSIKYDYNSLILDYWNKGILTKKTQLKRPGLMLLKKLGL